ncbi:MAG: hypothetical protein ABIO98_10800, partial [Chitinophagales bacterium]
MKKTLYNLCRRMYLQYCCLQVAVLILTALISSHQTFAQTVNAYTFAQGSNAYSAISGTALSFAGTTTTWDDNVASVTIPFTYTFNGTPYTSCSVNSNGYVTFGATVSSSSSYSAISSTTSYAGAIAAFSRDMINNATSITTGFIQSAPNRIFIIQWNNARRYSGGAVTGDVINFQIRLYETTNVAEVMYGTCTATSTTSLTCQVGLRGATNADFNNRSTATNWASTTLGGTNSSTCTTTNLIMPASGLTFSYTPAAPPACSVPTAVAVGSITAN